MKKHLAVAAVVAVFLLSGCAPTLIRTPEVYRVKKFAVASIYVERTVGGQTSGSEELAKALTAAALEDFSQEITRVYDWKLVPYAEIKDTPAFAELVKKVQAKYEEKSSMFQDEADKYRNRLKNRFLQHEGMPFIHLRGDGELDFPQDGNAVVAYLKESGLDGVAVIEISTLKMDSTDEASLNIGFTVLTSDPPSPSVKYAAVGRADQYRFAAGQKPGFGSLVRAVSGIKQLTSDPVKAIKEESERIAGLFKEAIHTGAVKYIDLLYQEKIKFAEKPKK